METMNNIPTPPAIHSGTPEEIKALLERKIDVNEKSIVFDREYYFSLLESGDFEGFLPARIRNMDTSTPEYESARSDTLEVRYEYFIDRFNDYLNEIRKDSPPYADISFLKETTHKVFKKVFLKQSPKEAFANNDELTRYKELLTKYLFDNFHVALAKATEDYSIHKLTDDEIDKLLEGVTKPRE